MLIEDFTFYWGHRILHLPKLYRFHKIHHEFTNTTSIAVLYCHPVEHIFALMLPNALGF